MTEYSVASEMVREFRSASERTAGWVATLQEAELCSPSVPRSELGDDDDEHQDQDNISEASDAESSHSIPPKFMLRWHDGRPDVPIPHMHDPGYHASMNPVLRSQTMPGHGYAGHPQYHPSARSYSHNHALIPQTPEDIRILPSKPLKSPSTASSYHHARSKSLPRDAYDPMTATPVRIVSQPLPPDAPLLHQPPVGSMGGPPVVYSHSHPPMAHPPSRGAVHGYPPKHGPPSIIYAPSHGSRNPHYRPPAIYTYPPNVGPNGMIYSHSAPVPGTHPYPNPGSTPYPSVAGSRSAHSHHHRSASRGREHRHGRHKSFGAGDDGSGGFYEPERGRSRSRSLGHGQGVAPYASQSSFHTQGSGSTYYVVPNGNQKIHIVRTPGLTYSGSSHSHSTKSPTTPLSPDCLKRNFLQKIMHFAERFSSAGSSRGSSHGGHGGHGGHRKPRLHRRHSMDRL